ncbi:hypothetical protein BOX15_Mlig007983g1 [Macrostomum lignano]|uniref:LRRCT domain-containing protein n=1 Tax=Macrostomum lignano TaxID=282301 RepID=A0A267ESC8_9PLAT|nr:hypothetical protein BOX15_Mlig007983g2 [Macrostomum lignano]PAA71150.1 hypothetical protein BOX15_Mlig007983g1 [Macrostomum lignano]
MRRFLLLQLLLHAIGSGIVECLDASSCAWRHCQDVVVSDAQPRLPAVGASSARFAAVSVHRCWLPPSPTPPKSVTSASSCDLPAGLSSPAQVGRFSLTRAGLTALPLTDLCRLFPSLTELDLSDNSIADGATSEPRTADSCQLSQLRWLSLRANKLNQLDLANYLERFPSLEQLDVSENVGLEWLFISRLMPERQFRLKKLNVASSGLKRVDMSLVRLVSLQDVNLSGNRLAEVTNRLNWVWTTSDVRAIERQRDRRRLEDASYYVRLSVLLLHNQFGPEAFGPNRLWGLPMPDIGPAKRQADAVVNQLKRFRDAFQSFVDIDNSGSTVACDCRLQHAWRFLRAVYSDPREFSKRNALSLDYWTSLPCFGQPAWRTVLSLNETDLVCRHAAACPIGCSCLETVRPPGLTVDCEGAGLTKLPQLLPVSVHGSLYELRLTRNSIADLSEVSDEAASLAPLVQGLDLSYNALTADTDFSPLARFTALRWLNITGNPMRDLPDSLLNLTAQRSRPRLLFTGQGFVCSCGLFQPAKWSQVRAALANYRDVQCDSETGERMRSLLEYRHRYCPARYNSTSVVYRERHVVNQSVVIGVGIVSGALVAVLFLITLVVVLTNLARRRRRQRPPAAVVAGRHRALESSAAAQAAADIAASSTAASAASPLVGVLCASSAGGAKCQQCRDQTLQRLLQHRPDFVPPPLRVGIPPDLVPSAGSPYDIPRYVDFDRFARNSRSAMKTSHSGSCSSDDIDSSDASCGANDGGSGGISMQETTQLHQEQRQRSLASCDSRRHRKRRRRRCQQQQQHQRRSLQSLQQPPPPPLPPPRLTTAPPLPPLPSTGGGSLIAIPPCAKYTCIGGDCGSGAVGGVETDV